MQPHRNMVGQVVVASLVDLVEDSIYKMRALVEGGDLNGKEVLVAHRGVPKLWNSRMVVRLDTPSPRSKMSLNDMPYAGYFITSNIPDGFNFALPNDVVLYGLWYNSMKGNHSIPFTTTVSDFYYFGAPVNILYFLLHDGSIIPLYLRQHMTVLRPSRVTSDLSESILVYSWEMEKNIPYCARVVLIDENIDFGNQVLPHFDRIKSRNGKTLIQMEPQQ